MLVRPIFLITSRRDSPLKFVGIPVQEDYSRLVGRSRATQDRHLRLRLLPSHVFCNVRDRPASVARLPNQSGGLIQTTKVFVRIQDRKPTPRQELPAYNTRFAGYRKLRTLHVPSK